MKLSLAAAAAVAIAVLSSLSPDDKGAPGVAWADMAQQLRSARTARIRRTINPPTAEQAASEDTFLWKAPDKSRTDATKPRALTTICNGSTQLTVDPQQKTYAIEQTDGPRGSLDWLLALAAVPPAKEGGGNPETSIEGHSVELVPVTTQVRQGRELRKYRMKLPESHGAPGEIKYAWFDVQTNRLALFTSEVPVAGTPYEAARVEVELDIELADELFSTTAPDGYREVSAESMTTASRPTAPAASRPAVFEEYIATRNEIDNYRLVAWSKRDGTVRLSGRSHRQGDVYRSDRFRPEKQILASAPAPIDPAQPWADPKAAEWAWSLSERKLILATTLPYRGKPASIQTYMRSLQGDGGPAALWPDPNSDRYLLSNLGWPLHYLGREIRVDGQPGPVYTQLPPRPDRPGLTGIRVEESQGLMTNYWIDPARDFLCIVHERYQRSTAPWKGNPDWRPAEPVSGKPPQQPRSSGLSQMDTMTRIVDFGRTPAGRWYPLTLSQEHYSIVDGQRYGPTTEEIRVQIEFDRPIPAELLKWPADVPEPKPFTPPHSKQPTKR